MDVHHHDSGTAAEGTGAAALMMALVAFVVGIVVLVALVAWAPWDDDDTGTANPVDQPGTEEGAPDTDVDIDGNIDIDGGDSAPEGEQPEDGQ